MINSVDSMTRQEIFIQSYENDIIEACKYSKIFASVCMAQACLETGYKGSGFCNNLFGIKGYGQPNEYWDGSVKLGDTIEYVGEKAFDYKLGFRVYKNTVLSIKDHNRLLMTSKTYAKVRQALTAEEQCRALQECGYATAPDYAKILIQIINKYNLKRLDNIDNGLTPTQRQEA
jgi:flagellum-specific peptidoglycan hydrolase FlgJ